LARLWNWLIGKNFPAVCLARQMFGSIVYVRGVQPVACGPKVARELTFCGPLLQEHALRFSKGTANLPCVASELFNRQSWTHAAVARGPI